SSELPKQVVHLRHDEIHPLAERLHRHARVVLRDELRVRHLHTRINLHPHRLRHAGAAHRERYGVLTRQPRDPRAAAAPATSNSVTSRACASASSWIGVASSKMNLPRPCVARMMSLSRLWMSRSRTGTGGRPFRIDSHRAPPFQLAKTPTSVPAYSKFLLRG